ARVLKRLGEVPVVQGGNGLDTTLLELVEELVVEVEAGLVPVARAGGLHTRPREAEAVRLQAEVRHDRHVVGVAVVVVVSDVTGVSVEGLPRGVREGVPDRRATSVFVDGALDL